MKYRQITGLATYQMGKLLPRNTGFPGEKVLGSYADLSPSHFYLCERARPHTAPLTTNCLLADHTTDNCYFQKLTVLVG